MDTDDKASRSIETAPAERLPEPSGPLPSWFRPLTAVVLFSAGAMMLVLSGYELALLPRSARLFGDIELFAGAAALLGSISNATTWVEQRTRRQVLAELEPEIADIRAKLDELSETKGVE